MEFVHQAYVPGETIAACATAPGEAGIAVVRISGAQAIEIASKVFSGNVHTFKTHTVHYGNICFPHGEKIDDGLLIVMKGPRSFTGEDVVELHCHGGTLIPKKVLEAVFVAGARPARPGEFSFRAYFHGKLDLAQAEAIQLKVAAKNELALRCAQEQLEGELSTRVRSFQKRLTDIAAIIEAWVDFPEEDLEFAPFEEVIASLQGISQELIKGIESFEQGKIIQQGLGVSLVGSPNVGKSSLMNALLGKERAIVSPIAGTTRDLIEDELRLGSLHLRLLDTAGIRKKEDFVEEIEKEGIRRSKKAIEYSDIILFVCDVTDPEGICEELVQELPADKTILIWNKIDLTHERPLPTLTFPYNVEVSAMAGIGLDELKKMIDKVIWQTGVPRLDEIIISSYRHKEALKSTQKSLEKVMEGLQSGVSAEFVAQDIRDALHSLGTIIGTNVGEDILTAVFSTFCIGK